ncbi:MAG: M4 family metallopeptidase, partial [Bacteroidia bacterium]
VNGQLTELPAPVNHASISEESALQKALQKVNAKTYKWENKEEEQHMRAALNQPDFSFYPKGELVLYRVNGKAQDVTLHYAYKFNIYAELPLYRANVFVDAATGAILAEENLICTINNVPGTTNTKYSGVQSFTIDNVSAGSYRLRESDRGLGIETYNLNNTTTYTNTDFTYTSSAWPNTAPIQVSGDAHWGAEMTYDYYLSQFSRNSIDGAGYKLLSYVHYGVNFNNAYWNGTCMTYGDGDGVTFTGFTCQDICGHEITHGLTNFTAGLGGSGSGEPGALNEAFSDIFGSNIENYARPTNWDWKIGADVTPGGAGLRNMSNPKILGQPNTYKGINWDFANQEVHQNNGPCIYWYYLLCQGGSGTNDNSSTYTVTGLGRTKAASIAYRALTIYFISTTNYAMARAYSIQAATDLYGACSNEVFQTQNAWYAVGVGPASSGTNSPVSNFSSSSSVMCTLPVNVNFANTTFGGTSYVWDFGDGSPVSTVTNPAHTYTANGTYSVKLKSTSACAASPDSIIKPAYIVISSPTPPSATGGVRCGPGSVNLSASGTGQLNWYINPTASGTPLYTGANYTTPFITGDVTYYVANTFTNATISGAPTNTAIGTTASYPSNTAYDSLDVLQPCTLRSVLVYANFAGNRTIELRDRTNAVLQSTVVNLPAGPSTVNLDFPLTVGTGYRLGLNSASTAQLYRNGTGASYPYNIGGLVKITGSSGGAAQFFFFYNWVIQPGDCMSSATPVTATVMPGPFLTVNQPTICAGQTVSLTAAGATSYTWSTGPNTTSIAVTPSTTTNYTIYANNGGCVTSNVSTVVVNANPVVSISTSSSNVCAGDSLVGLTGMPAGGTFSGSNVSGTSFNPLSAGSYTITYNYTDANTCSGSNKVVMSVGVCAGVHELNASSGLSVYPNPASDQFVVKNENSIGLVLKLTDATGKLIMERTIVSTSEQIDISRLARGIYFVELQGNTNAAYRTKLIKQ